MFDTSIHFHPSLTFVSKADISRLERLMGVHSNERLLASLTNIRPGWKCMKVENALAFYNTATITTIKSFKVQAPRVV